MKYFIFETINGKQINEEATLIKVKTLFNVELEKFLTTSGKKFHPNYVRFEKII